MRGSRRLSLDGMGVMALTLGLMLSGCGGASTAQAGRGAIAKAPTPSPTAAATATTSTEATGPVDIPQFAGCPEVNAPTQPKYVAAGALKVSVPLRLPGQDYPSELMPNNAPNKPYPIAASAVNTYAPNPPVNPSLDAGYYFQICNQSTAAHTVSSVSVTIASFAASSGAVTVWHLCQDGPYNAATKQTTGGCGGAFGAVGWLAATLPSDHSGASATAGANAPHSAQKLPVSIGPNMSIQLLVAVKGLTSQGTYTLKFGVSVDGAAATTLAPSDGPFLIAPSAVVWTGTACQAPAMQTQIPAASQDTYYVCPPA